MRGLLVDEQGRVMKRRGEGRMEGEGEGGGDGKKGWMEGGRRGDFSV